MTRKPVVVLKQGVIPAPNGQQRATRPRSPATSPAVIYAGLRQAGVHLVEDGMALLDVAASLDRQPPLRGRNIGIITNSGGTGVELTDLAQVRKVSPFPALSPGLQATIANQLPPQGSAVNPVDVTTNRQRFAAMYEFTVEALMTSGEVDAVVPVLSQRSALMPEVSDAVIAASRERVAGLNQAHPRSAGWRRDRPTPIAKNCRRPGYPATLGLGRRLLLLPPLSRDRSDRWHACRQASQFRGPRLSTTRAG